MGRTRNWSADTSAEVFIRLFDLKQNHARVARATGLTYQQVSYFVRGCTDDKLPDGVDITQENVDRLRPVVEAASAAEDAEVHAVTQRRLANTRALADAKQSARAAPIDSAALNDEVEGCIDLVRQAAAQFGITPRHFLWLCSTHARSAG